MKEENKVSSSENAEDVVKEKAVPQTPPEEGTESLPQQEAAVPDEMAVPEPEQDVLSEPEQTETQAPQESSHKIKDILHSQKVKRRGMSTVFTAGFLAIILLLNVVVSMLGQRFPSINLDLTAQKVNTLSEDVLKALDTIKLPTTITILGAESDIRDNVLYLEYGFQYSQVAILADKMKERNPNIKVEYVDLDKNPTYASSIGEPNLNVGSVVVSTEKRNRVLQATDLFNLQTDYTTGQTNSYSMVGTALASAISQTNSERLPVIAFATGHEEIYDTTALQSVLGNANFEIKNFNILTDAVPENAQMVMLASPTKDYTAEELAKLDAFLANNTTKTDRSLLITFYPSQSELPNFSNFLKEWGIEVPRSMIVETDQSHIAQTDASYILTKTGVDSTVDFGSGTTDYGYVVMPASCPINLLFTSRDGVTTKALAASYDSTYLIDANNLTNESTKTPSTQSYTTVALAQKNMGSYKQNVIVAGSSPMFAEGIINASAYGNGTYVTDLVRYATGETDSNTGLPVTQIQMNQIDINLSQASSLILGFVFTVFIPLCVLIAGFIVYLKRRHL